MCIIRGKTLGLMLAVVFVLSLAGCTESAPLPEGLTDSATGNVVMIGMQRDEVEAQADLEIEAFSADGVVFYNLVNAQYDDENSVVQIYTANGDEESGQTSEGICHGSSRNEVIAAYGKPNEEEDGYLRYQREGRYFSLYVVDDKVRQMMISVAQ